MSSVAGVRISGTSGSLDTGTSGLAFTIAETSVIRVVKTSCVRCLEGTSASTALSKRLITPIIRSQAPPAWDAWGGLKTHSHPSLSR